MMHFTARENEVLRYLKRRIKKNQNNLEGTKIDLIEMHLISMLLRDFWVIEEKVEGVKIPEEMHYLYNPSHHEKETLYGLMHAIGNNISDYINPSYKIGLGESVLIDALLYTHLMWVDREVNKELQQLSEKNNMTNKGQGENGKQKDVV